MTDDVHPSPEPADEGVKAGIGVMAAACVSTLIVNANTSAVTILLPAIGDDLNTPISTLQWAVTGYSLVGAACIVTSGALGDVFGRRKIFLGGLFLFIASCVLIAFAPGGIAVILGRCIQGAAGSTLLASGLSLLTIASSGSERLRAVSYWGSASAIGAAAGPLIGGLLVDTTGWQGLFWIDAAIAVVLVPVTLRSVSESSDPNRSHSIDWLGTVLIALVLAPFILGVSEGADWGWVSVPTLACFAVAVASIVAFVFTEQKVPAPLVDLQLLRNKVLIGATLGILIGAAAINGLMFVLSLFFQDPSTLGMTPLQAGLATLPATVGMVALTPAVPKLASKFGTRIIIGVGFILMTVGFALLLGTRSTWGYALFVAPLVLAAIGMCLSNNPCSSVATSSVDASQVGAASGISNMARYVGAAVMTAIVAAFYSVVSTDRQAGGASAGDALAAGFRAASLSLVVVSALGVVLVFLIGRHRPATTTAADIAIAAAAPAHTIPRPGAA
jgi:EmrB/QacA subfamily drug resistance transporter